MSRCCKREGARQRALSLLAFGAVLLVLLAGVVTPSAGAAQRQKPQALPVVVEIRDSGFHWSDAGVGAAGAIGFLCVGGVAFLLRRTAPN